MTENLHNDVQMRKPISFRLDLESHRTLTQRAAELDMSPHRLAQHYVIQHLAEEEERAALHDAIAFLHQELVDLRKDFLSVKEALLASAGHASPEEAAPWVNMHYRPPSDD